VSFHAPIGARSFTGTAACPKAEDDEFTVHGQKGEQNARAQFTRMGNTDGILPRYGCRSGRIRRGFDKKRIFRP
jgi:hypothetical protein